MRIPRHLLQHTIQRPIPSATIHQPTQALRRVLSTLPSNPHIYIHPSPGPSSSPSSGTYTLSYSSRPPSPRTAIGHSSSNPPTPGTFSANPNFTKLLHETLARHAHADPAIKAAAVAFAATNVGPGAGVGVGNVLPSGSAALKNRRKGSRIKESGATPEKTDEGDREYIGFMHVADERNPAVYGRIPEPEDIFGTLQVGPQGAFVDGNGAYQESGTYRVLTKEGCLGLSDFLRKRLLERLDEEEGKQ